MQKLAELQGQFARAVLDPDAAVPAQIVGPDGRHSTRRFGVYRNNVVVGLIEALQASYPITCKIVGEEFFRAMARIHVSAHPPRSPVMLEYGDDFADFIAGFAPAESLPYLADVARLERAWTQSYHAADATPITGDDLKQVDPSQLSAMSLKLHPAIRFLKSDFPVLAIWKMNVENKPAPIELESGGDEILVCRPDHEVSVFPLPAGTFPFLLSLSQGATLERAAQSAWARNPGFEITRSLTGLIECGAFTGWVIESSHKQTSDGDVYA